MKRRYFLLAAILMGLSVVIYLAQKYWPATDGMHRPTYGQREGLDTARSERPSSLVWVGCDVSRKAFMGELASAYQERTGTVIEIAGGGATRGIRDTASMVADMGGSCRHVLPITEEENALLVQVAWDALVVIVHPGNPVEEISLSELKAVLTGQIENWKELRGPDEEIHVVVRDQGLGGKMSGVGMMTRELVFFDREQGYTDNSTAVMSSGPLEEIVEQDRWAVGVTGISSAKRRRVKCLRLDGNEPSYENIASGEYPLFRPLYLVLPKVADQQESVVGFVSFSLSDEGQDVLKRAGTVTLEDGAALWRPYREKMLRAGVRMGDY